MKIVIGLMIIILGGLPCRAETNNLQELTGVFLIGPFGAGYTLKIDGTDQTIDLDGNLMYGARIEDIPPMLKNIHYGTRVWVQGEIRTVLRETVHVASKRGDVIPKHWEIVMDVKKIETIVKEFERPNESQNKPSEATRK